MPLSLVVNNDAPPVNTAIIERRGSLIILTIDGGISHSAYQFHASAPADGLAWERRANESWEQFHNRVFQAARANGVKLLTFGGFPSISHAQELDLIDRAKGLADGARITVPLGA